MAQSDIDDLLRRQNSRPDGAQPGTELAPNGGGLENGEALEKALGDDTELDVAVVGGEFTSHLLPIGVRFAVKILIAGTA